MKRLFTSFAVAATALSCMAANHTIKAVTGGAKDNPWDTQIYLKFADAKLEAGKSYTITFDAKATAAFAMGVTSCDLTSEHKDPWGNTGAFCYEPEMSITEETQNFSLTFKSHSENKCHEHKNVDNLTSHNDNDACGVEAVDYSTNALILNLGKLDGTICIDNIVIKNADGEVVYTNDLEGENAANAVSKPSWHTHVAEIAEEATTDALKSVAKTSADKTIYSIDGHTKKATKGLSVVDGKVVYIK